MKKEINITEKLLTQTMFVSMSMSMFIISIIITLWGNM